MRRTILITGSAKRLGAALAKGLAKDGHRVAIHFRSSQAEAQETRKAILEAGGEAALFQSPLATLDDGAKLAHEVVTHFGQLDTLVNNAGAFPRKAFEKLTQEEWEIGISSSVGAAFYATRACLPHLRSSGRGRIVNIGDSMSDRFGFAEPGLSYYVGKGGVWLMTRTLAAIEARHKITVNMISPGVIEDSFCKTPLSEMPLGRHGIYEDVLRPIRFLLEEGSDALTGSNLQVGGGWNIAPR